MEERRDIDRDGRFELVAREGEVPSLRHEGAEEWGRDDIPEDLCRSLSFVKQISNLHDTGFRELTPGLSGELDTAIEVLRKYRDFEPYVENMLGSALSLRESMPEIRSI